MKKLFSYIVVICLITIIMLVTTVSVSADDTMIFNISNGLNIEKDREATFDSSRTISGIAKKGTIINITLYTEDSEGDLWERDSYSIVVGSSGYFSQNINFYIGTNHIIIEAQNEGQASSYETTVKRKDSQIKDDLRQSIALPGLNR